MRYVIARIEEENRQSAYRIYVSDTLYALALSVATDNKSYQSKRFVEILNPEVPDERTYEDIVSHVLTSIWGKE